MARRLRPDVVVMDIRMPVLNGIDATRHLTSLRPPPGRVLILTTFGDEEYVFASLRAGASGFLLKNAPAEELTGGVRTVAAGDALLAPAVTRLVVERYLASAGQTQDGQERIAALLGTLAGSAADEWATEVGQKDAWLPRLGRVRSRVRLPIRP